MLRESIAALCVNGSRANVIGKPCNIHPILLYISIGTINFQTPTWLSKYLRITKSAHDHHVLRASTDPIDPSLLPRLLRSRFQILVSSLLGDAGVLLGGAVLLHPGLGELPEGVLASSYTRVCYRILLVTFDPSLQDTLLEKRHMQFM